MEGIIAIQGGSQMIESWGNRSAELWVCHVGNVRIQDAGEVQNKAYSRRILLICTWVSHWSR